MRSRNCKDKQRKREEGEIAGYNGIPVDMNGDPQGFCDFYVRKDYPLKFKIKGYYDLRQSRTQREGAIDATKRHC